MYKTADQELETAKESVRTAITALSRIVIEQCDGYDDFRSEYQEKMHESLMALLEIRKKLTV